MLGQHDDQKACQKIYRHTRIDTAVYVEQIRHNDHIHKINEECPGYTFLSLNKSKMEKYQQNYRCANIKYYSPEPVPLNDHAHGTDKYHSHASKQ